MPPDPPSFRGFFFGQFPCLCYEPRGSTVNSTGASNLVRHWFQAPRLETCPLYELWCLYTTVTWSNVGFYFVFFNRNHAWIMMVTETRHFLSVWTWMFLSFRRPTSIVNMYRSPLWICYTLVNMLHPCECVTAHVLQALCVLRIKSVVHYGTRVPGPSLSIRSSLNLQHW